LVFPVADIVASLRAAGVLSLVDGAHAPGMVEVDLASLGADFWTGNFHKWCCAPRGAAGLHVAPEHRQRIVPLVTSWDALEGFTKSFGYLGTDDYTAYLCVPNAIEFMAALGWERVRAHNRALAREGARLVRKAIGSAPEWSDEESLFEAMAVVSLPDTTVRTLEEGKLVSRRLADGFGIEAPVFPWRDRGFLRLSAQAYNAPSEYERLARALPEVLRAL
jgi:isopenicillin-N epimerase